MLPAIIGGQDNLHAWLKDKLEPLAMLKVERVRVRDLLASEWGRAKLAKSWRRLSISDADFRRHRRSIDQAAGALSDDYECDREDSAALSKTDVDDERDEAETIAESSAANERANGDAH